MDLGSKSPIYDILLLAHIVCAIGGFGANGLAGYYAGQLSPDPSEQAIKYFSSPSFLAEKLLYLVPVFGLIMIGVSHGMSEFSKPWINAGIVLWILAIGVAHSLVWPSERKIAEIVSSNWDRSNLPQLSKKLNRGALILDIIFVLAFVVMISQPGGK